MIGWILMAVGVVAGVLTFRFTRKPREEVVEVVEPDVVFTTDPAPENTPHSHVVHETYVEEEREPHVVRHVEETRPHAHRVEETQPHLHREEQTRIYRDGPV